MLPDKEQEIIEKRVSLGIRLKAFRKTENLSQDEFCEIVGLSQAHYSLIEQGKVDSKISLITKILLAFKELTFEALFDESEDDFLKRMKKKKAEAAKKKENNTQKVGQ